MIKEGKHASCEQPLTSQLAWLQKTAADRIFVTAPAWACDPVMTKYKLCWHTHTHTNTHTLVSIHTNATHRDIFQGTNWVSLCPFLMFDKIITSLQSFEFWHWSFPCLSLKLAKLVTSLHINSAAGLLQWNGLNFLQMANKIHKIQKHQSHNFAVVVDVHLWRT